MKTYEIDYNGNYIIMSDIHGNHIALEACIDDAFEKYGNSIKGFIFLGDYSCDYPYSNKVIDLILKLKENYECYCIKGNRESGMVDQFYEKTKNFDGAIDLNNAQKITGWSIDTSMGCPLIDCLRLSKKHLEFLTNLPESLILKNKKQTILIKHKTPLSEEEIKLLKEAASQTIETENGIIERECIVLTGHTHDVSNAKYDYLTHFNPGGVGLADTGLPGTYYGVLNHGKLISKHIEYDYQKAIEELENETILFEKCCKWGDFLKSSITTGLNTTVLYINECKRLTEEFKKLSPEAAKKFIELNSENAIEIGKMMFPPLDMDKETSLRGRYGNTNPFGDYVEFDIYTYNQEINEIEITKKNINSDDITPPKKSSANNDVYTPTTILNEIAREYTNIYIEYLTKKNNEFYVNRKKWK